MNDCLMKMVYVKESLKENKMMSGLILLIEEGQRVNFSGLFVLEDGVRQYLFQLTSPSSHPSIKEFIYRLVMNDVVQL